VRDLTSLTAGDFEPLVDSAFQVNDARVQEVSLRLARVTRLPERLGYRPPFSLHWIGPPAPILSQQIHHLTHPDIGRPRYLSHPDSSGCFGGDLRSRLRLGSVPARLPGRRGELEFVATTRCPVDHRVRRLARPRYDAALRVAGRLILPGQAAHQLVGIGRPRCSIALATGFLSSKCRRGGDFLGDIGRGIV
jgi:hypothetical protein